MLADGETAVVEMARASGISLVAESERDAEAASTGGTGELILAAVAAGARTVLVTVGGSATTDGGAGAIEVVREGGGLGRAKLSWSSTCARRSSARPRSTGRRRARTRPPCGA